MVKYMAELFNGSGMSNSVELTVGWRQLIIICQSRHSFQLNIGLSLHH